MSDKLLYHYEKELAFIQQSANEFAKQHPAAASRLQLGSDTVDDPLVARLLSGFAYQNARIQQKLNDDFPELTDALLDTLYPHYLRPIPSMAIMQFEPAEDLDAAAQVPRHELLQTDNFDGQTCRFNTCYPVEILPLTVSSAQLLPRPFIAPASNEISGAGSVLKLSMNVSSAGINLQELGIEQLRFFLRGQPQHVYPLYEALLTQCLAVVVASGEDDSKPTVLPPKTITPVGFGKDEAMLPYPDTAFSGYRLLTEYFAFPEKFHFLDVGGLKQTINDGFSESLNLYIYLAEAPAELEHQVNAGMFALGCTPVVNLFEASADPISLTHSEYNYRIVPDARRPEGLEVYSVQKVGATDVDGKYTPYRPFYGIQHARSSERQSAFWLTRREEVVEGEHLNEVASEMDIALVDLDFNPHQTSDQTLDLSLLCSNRNVPRKLPTGQGSPLMSVVDGEAPVSRIACVVNPTATIRPPLRERGYWRLISHLNLNHLSLSAGGGSCDALKEILRLYDFKDSASTRSIVESVLSLQTSTVTAPIETDGHVAMCRGTQVQIELDPMMLSGTSALLFASVLEHFCGLYCSVNSFTRMIATLHGKDGELKRWPPRAGDKALI